MTIGGRKTVLAVLLLAMITSTALVPAFSYDSDAADPVPGYVFDASPDTITLCAGDTTNIDVTVRNTNAYVENNLENLIFVKFTTTVTDETNGIASTVSAAVMNVETGSPSADINPQDSTHFTISVTCDRSTKFGDYNLTYSYAVFDNLGTQLGTGSITHTISVVGAYTDDSDDADPVPEYVFDTSPVTISVPAGGSTNIDVTVRNTNPFIQDSLLNLIFVKFTTKVTDGSGNTVDDIDSVVKNTETGKSNADIDPQDSTHFTITVSPDRYARFGDYTLTYTYTVCDYLGTEIHSDSIAHTLHINSAFSTSDTYNKFLGFIDNPFEGVIGMVWFTAIVTFLAWLLIGAIVIRIAVPIVTHLMTRSDDPDRPLLRKTLIKQLRIVNIVYAIVNTTYILGANETTISTVKSIATIIYIIVGVGIAWRIYRTALDRLSVRMRGRDMFPGGEIQDFESYKPLLIYIGEILLAISAVFSIMSVLGFDMGAIITSAGVVSLGITFGAQQVLNQFFSGLVILSTRPFKKGDLVQLGSNTIVYRIRRVNIMNTELENWDNSDITIVPNNSITANSVKNITRDTLRTKVHLFVEVSYQTDIALARQALLDVANANPRVIKDGSVSKPSTRLTDFADSNIVLRLTVWVDDYNDHGSIGGELRVAIFQKFNELGINIDYPQVVLHSADPQSPKDVGTADSAA